MKSDRLWMWAVTVVWGAWWTGFSVSQDMVSVLVVLAGLVYLLYPFIYLTETVLESKRREINVDMRKRLQDSSRSQRLNVSASDDSRNKQHPWGGDR